MSKEGQSANNLKEHYTQVRVTSRTTMARFGLNWEETARLAHRHSMAVEIWLSSRSPQGNRFDGVGTTATSTGIEAYLLNLAHDSDFPPATRDEEIDNEIETVKLFFAKQGVSFIWYLSPFAKPSDMGQRLIRHGFEPEEYHVPAMVAPLSSSTEWPSVNPEVQVWQANDRADLEAASSLRRTGFRFAEGVALTYFEDMAGDWLRGNPARLYMARVGDDGPPLATGALIMGEGLPGVYGMVTLPASQRQGLGKAILVRILSDAAADEHELIVLTATPQAYSLYRKFGFEHIFDFTLYCLP